MAWKTFTRPTLWTLTDDTLATIQFSGRMPTVFVTGDAHRNPPFQWIGSCESLERHFEYLVEQRQLCAHVEQHRDQVTLTSVPFLLHKLISQKRIFGWELEIYRYLEPVMREYLLGFEGLPKQLKYLDNRNGKRLIERLDELHHNIREVDRRLRAIDNAATLKGKMVAHEEYLKYYKYLYKGTGWWGAQPKRPAKKYSQFLKEYYEAADGLRTSEGVHKAIGRKIQTALNTYPGCTHLIACGNAHINGPISLDRFILLPRGANGVVDVDDGMLRFTPRRRSRTVATGARTDG